MKNLDVFTVFILIRLASVFLIQTFYVPDEFWQSLEVAHKLTFGYGYLTWEWVIGLRSYVHPLIIAVVYKILSLFALDSAQALIYVPRILQAFLSAYADLCFYRWSGTKKWAVFNIACAWFWFYNSSRTIINTVESCLTVIALSHFPWIGKESGNNSRFIWILAFLCAIRPTAAIPWIPLVFYHLMTSNDKVFNLILKNYLSIGATTFILSVVLDSWAHGRFVITSYEFFKFNVISGVGEWYGVQPWHWYLSCGFPAILGIHLIPFVLATLKILKDKHSHPNELALLTCITFTVAVYSFLPHKEFRFILPVLPIAIFISSNYLSKWSRKASSLLLWLVAGTILTANVIPMWYLGFVHQRGALDVMHPLREAAKHDQNTSLLFLMPCHSTPLYSHLHCDIKTRFLTCEPNFANNKDYIDEADQFYNNPSLWLKQQYPPNSTWPSHVIIFDSLLPRIENEINSKYKLVETIFHSSISQGRIGRNILLYQKMDKINEF